MNNMINIGEKRLAKYNPIMNDFDVSHLTAKELNIFIAIITQMQDEGSDTITIMYDDLKKILDFESEFKGHRVRKVLDGLGKSLAKILFIERNEDTETYEKTIKPIFSDLKIYIDKTNTNNSYFRCQLSNKTVDLVNNLDKWVIFDVKEFAKIRSKNAKILYKILKQFRTTGKVILSVSKVKQVFGVTDQKVSYLITRDCIKTPIQKLEPYFSNLKYERKIKNGKLDSYVITFKPEQTRKPTQKSKKGYKKRPVHSHKEIATDWSKYAPTPTTENGAELKKSNNMLDDILAQVDSQGVNS